jgi:hypothetical protein
MGGYGADVTPRIFYENFIEMMVTIDASDGSKSLGVSTPRHSTFARVQASLI